MLTRFIFSYSYFMSSQCVMRGHKLVPVKLSLQIHTFMYHDNIDSKWYIFKRNNIKRNPV